MAKFSAQVSDFTKDSKHAMQRVNQSAIQGLTNDVVSDTPKDTGNASWSWLGTTDAMPPIREDSVEFNASNATSVAIMGLKAGDTFYFGAQAAYIPRLNYGFTKKDKLGRQYNQSGIGWIERRAADWPSYVKTAENKFKVT